MFKSKLDADVNKKIYSQFPILIKENPHENVWNIKYERMFDMTNDSDFFIKDENFSLESYNGLYFQNKDEILFPLYEAKMIFHYDHRYASAIPPKSGNLRGSSEYTTDDEHKNKNYFVKPRFWVNKDNIPNLLKEKNG